MAKKTTPRARPRSAEPVSPSPEIDSAATGAAQPATIRRRAAKAPGARQAKTPSTRAVRATRTLDPAAAATGSAAVRRPRRASELPTQAVEQTQTPAPVLPAEAISEEDIRMRAYFLSLERGPHSGSDLDHWLQAERELRSRIRR